MLIKCTIQDGFIDAQKIAKIETINGTEQVAVSGVLIENSALRVSQVNQRQDQCLVELPVESASGNWRVWVDQNQILSTAT